MHSIVSIPEKDYNCLLEHLLPFEQDREQAAFVFADTFETADALKFEYKDLYLLPSQDFVIQSAYHIELTDKARAKVIKRAHDLKTSLIEFHSHLSFEEPGFSGSDMAGFSEFVPHVLWRLKGRPYVAIVVSKSGFDALLWYGTDAKPETLSELRVGKRSIKPSGATLREEGF